MSNYSVQYVACMQNPSIGGMCCSQHAQAHGVIPDSALSYISLSPLSTGHQLSVAAHWHSGSYYLHLPWGYAERVFAAPCVRVQHKLGNLGVTGWTQQTQQFSIAVQVTMVSHIHAFVRVRPLLPREFAQSASEAVSVSPGVSAGDQFSQFFEESC